MKRAASGAKLNSVPPQSIATCFCPPSVSGINVDTVPFVWPGVRYIVSVVLPSVSFSTVGDHEVARRLPARVVALDQVPIRRAHQQPRAEALLEQLRAARVIEVTVADEHVTDVGGIKAELAQAADDLVLDRVVEQRVDHDDAVRRRHGPGREFRHADEVEIVEDFLRLGVPALARRIRWRRSVRGRHGRRHRRRRARAQPVDHPGVLRAGRLSCRGDMAVDVRRCGGSVSDGGCCYQRRRPAPSPTCPHASSRYGSANTTTRAPPESAASSGVTLRDVAATSDGPVVTATYCLPPAVYVIG